MLHDLIILIFNDLMGMKINTWQITIWESVVQTKSPTKAAKSEHFC
jgi:hypothetical protein